MRETSGRACLATKAFRRLRLSCELLPDALDGDETFQRGIGGLVDGTHASIADAAIEAIPTGQMSR